MKLRRAKIGEKINFFYLENDRYIGQRAAVGKYEPYETQLILRQAKVGGTVIDVGANIGYYTLILADKVGKNGKVYAFEPDKINFEILEKNIKYRLLARMRLGLVAEVKKLHRQGLSWRRMEELGLEYRYLALLEQKKTSREQMIKELEKEIVRYAKRQITWFKRDKRISWFNPTDKKLLEKVLKLINEN